jgi:hypothetical protein
MAPSRFDYLTALRRQGTERDYSDDGEVGEAVRQFVADNDEWFLRSRIAYALDVSLTKVEALLWRLVRKRQIQIRLDERGQMIGRRRSDG